MHNLSGSLELKCKVQMPSYHYNFLSDNESRVASPKNGRNFFQTGEKGGKLLNF